MPHRVRPVAALAAVVLALALGAAACGGSDGGSDPEAAGLRARAVEQLRDYGLPEGQAECVVDALGADVVAATPEMDVLAAGQPYQDAIDGCPA